MAAILFITDGPKAQLSRSPYTILGIGETQGMGLSNHEAMGGVGIAYGRPYHINNINPALLPMNVVTSFDIAAMGDRRMISSDSLNQRNASINISHLAFAFPVLVKGERGRWTFSIGLKPYSVVDYNIRTISQVAGSDDELEMSFSGDGGLNQAYFATGVRLFENLYAGFRAGYFFGSINDYTTVDPFLIEDEDSLFLSQFKASYYRRTSFSDFGFSGGAAYVADLSDEMSLSIGGIYEFETDLSASRHERLDRRGRNDQINFRDTIVSQEKGFITLPAKYGLGLALNKGINWALAVDFEMQDWTRYRTYDRQSGGLGKSYRFAAGFEFVPNYNSVTGYFQRVFYRTGFYYEQTPYLKNNHQIKEFGINFGVALPVSGGSLINLNVGYGQRGFSDASLIRENILKFGLGITFNDQRWFIRRKYD